MTGKYISISTRISILLGMIILITFGIFSSYSLMKHKEDSLNAINNNAVQLSHTIEKILRFSMLKNRREEISMSIKNVINKDGIISVRILDHKGLIKLSSSQSEVNTHISQTNLLCTGCHNENENSLNYHMKDFNRVLINREKNFISDCIPIYNASGCSNQNCHSISEKDISINESENSNSPVIHSPSQTILGFIEIEVSTKQIISNFENTRFRLIIVIILFAFITAVVAYFSIRFLIGKPVKNLVEGTIRVAKGDFKNEIPPGKAELKILAESFNRMQKQLVSTQTQLIESEKLASIGKLADEIAYDINNPLTGIIIYCENLMKESPKEDITKDLEVIRSQALKIRESIKNVFSFTRHEKSDIKTTNINQLVDHTISVVKKFPNFRNIQINERIPPNLPQIPADPGLLEHVFLNLLLISEEELQDGGIINITAFYEENIDKIRIVFTDSSKGIPPEILQNIFDYSNVTLGKFEMTGVSLIVCKNIIEMHKGELIVTSSPASGNSFIIKLPVE